MILALDAHHYLMLRPIFGPVRWFLSILLTLGFAACTADSEPVRYRLTSKERQRVDSLVAQEVRRLRPLNDSLCEAAFAERVSDATDSIVQERLEQELRLRARIPLNRTER